MLEYQFDARVCRIGILGLIVLVLSVCIYELAQVLLVVQRKAVLECRSLAGCV